LTAITIPSDSLTRGGTVFFGTRPRAIHDTFTMPFFLRNNFTNTNLTFPKKPFFWLKTGKRKNIPKNKKATTA